MDNDSSFALPNLKEIFQQLRTGRHISAEDGVIYQDIVKHEDAFTELFQNLGFDMEKHSRAFFFFRGEDKVGDGAALMALFMFILVDYLAGKGIPIEQSIMGEEFQLVDLPHLGSERYLSLMKDGNISDPESLGKLLRRMDRLGFITYREPDIRFRTPAYRFLDLCLQVHQETNMDENYEDT